MNKDEAIKELADRLRYRHEQAIARAEALANGHATVEPVQMDFTLQAGNLLDAAATHVAFLRACDMLQHEDHYGFTLSTNVAGAPPPSTNVAGASCGYLKAGNGAPPFRNPPPPVGPRPPEGN